MSPIIRCLLIIVISLLIGIQSKTCKGQYMSGIQGMNVPSGGEIIIASSVFLIGIGALCYLIINHSQNQNVKKFIKEVKKIDVLLNDQNFITSKTIIKSFKTAQKYYNVATKRESDFHYILKLKDFKKQFDQQKKIYNELPESKTGNN